MVHSLTMSTPFSQQDHTIAEDRLRFQLTGGCTACVSLFIHGKLFLANAGDSRAVISLGSVPLPMSFDFTPESENQRIRKLVRLLKSCREREMGLNDSENHLAVILNQSLNPFQQGLQFVNSSLILLCCFINPSLLLQLLPHPIMPSTGGHASRAPWWRVHPPRLCPPASEERSRQAGAVSRPLHEWMGLQDPHTRWPQISTCVWGREAGE